MSNDSLPQSEFIVYRTEDGRTRIQCRFEDETLWLSQVQITELFQTTVPNINLHLKAICGEGELAAEGTIKSHLMVRSKGFRQVSRAVFHYGPPFASGELTKGSVCSICRSNCSQPFARTLKPWVSVSPSLKTLPLVWKSLF